MRSKATAPIQTASIFATAAVTVSAGMPTLTACHVKPAGKIGKYSFGFTKPSDFNWEP